jgi:hypothetical protein
MCEPESPRVDDAPGEPVGQEGKVQATIRICGQWIYNGITTDVATLQRLLKDAVRSSDRLIDRLRKARAQRDAARAELERTTAELLRRRSTIEHDGGVIADLNADLAKVALAIHEAEVALKIRKGGTNDPEWVNHADIDERITRIADIARKALHTAMLAQGGSRAKTIPSDRSAHYLDYILSPQMVALDHGDTLVASTVDRLTRQFQAEGYAPRAIVIRVQDFL